MVTHQLQVERRTGKVRRSKTEVLPTVPRNQPEEDIFRGYFHAPAFQHISGSGPRNWSWNCSAAQTNKRARHKTKTSGPNSKPYEKASICRRCRLLPAGHRHRLVLQVARAIYLHHLYHSAWWCECAGVWVVCMKYSLHLIKLPYAATVYDYAYILRAVCYVMSGHHARWEKMSQNSTFRSDIVRDHTMRVATGIERMGKCLTEKYITRWSTGMR